MPLSALDRLRRRPPRAAAPLTIGLVNNMPDAALGSTERQFGELLARAAGGTPLALRVFSFPELPRSPEGRRHVAAHHEPIARLWDGDLAGLIVTGTAPAAPRLEDEPFWPTLARLVDWAARRTRSTIFSCLAAHAAVRRLDGIERRPLDRKLSGVFACTRLADHPLVAAGPAQWPTPHSRHNALPESALLARGYRILSRSPAAGADIFVKPCGSLFVFLQGHPEYDAGALYREYRRDVARYLAGNAAAYPDMPQNYFAPPTAAAMRAFRRNALRAAVPPTIDRFPQMPPTPAPWHHAATKFYSAWIEHIAGYRAGRASTPFARGAARALEAAYA